MSQEGLSLLTLQQTTKHKPKIIMDKTHKMGGTEIKEVGKTKCI